MRMYFDAGYVDSFVAGGVKSRQGRRVLRRATPTATTTLSARGAKARRADRPDGHFARVGTDHRLYPRERERGEGTRPGAARLCWAPGARPLGADFRKHPNRGVGLGPLPAGDRSDTNRQVIPLAVFPAILRFRSATAPGTKAEPPLVYTTPGFLGR